MALSEKGKKWLADRESQKKKRELAAVVEGYEYVAAPEPLNEENTELTAREILREAGMISAAELDRKVFPPLQWHVPGLVPEGFGLIAAPPKAGKSWLVADVGLACAIGGIAFGCIEVAPRPVLYLALEDGERRLQDRHRTLLGRDEEKPPRMNLIVRATPLTAPAIIAAFLELNGENQPLIVVDTLVKIRPQRRAGDEPYQFDYMFAARLKASLDGYPGAGLWAVHHARKAVAEDFVAEGSGTYGLAGAADYVMVLRHPRLAMHASLLVTGRDVPEGEYALVSNRGCGWRLDGEDLTEAAVKAATRQQEGRLGDRALDLLKFFNQLGKPAGPTEAARATGIEEKQIRVYLKRLVESGHLRKEGRGLYVSGVTSVTSVTSPGQGAFSESNSPGAGVTFADALTSESNGSNTCNTSLWEDEPDEPDYSGLESP